MIQIRPAPLRLEEQHLADDAQHVAAESGVTLVRTASLNDDPAFLDVLATRVIATAGS